MNTWRRKPPKIVSKYEATPQISYLGANTLASNKNHPLNHTPFIFHNSRIWYNIAASNRERWYGLLYSSFIRGQGWCWGVKERPSRKGIAETSGSKKRSIDDDISAVPAPPHPTPSQMWDRAFSRGYKGSAKSSSALAECTEDKLQG